MERRRLPSHSASRCLRRVATRVSAGVRWEAWKVVVVTGLGLDVGSEDSTGFESDV